MKRLTAFGAIGMLITLLIIGLIFVLIMPAIKDIGGMGLNKSSIDNKSLEQKIDDQILEIEKYRLQNAQNLQKLNQEN